MKKILLSTTVVAGGFLYAQLGVGIENPQAMLDVVSSNSGILLPRVSSSEAVTTKIESLLIYDVSQKRFEYYDGASFVPLGAAATAALPMAMRTQTTQAPSLTLLKTTDSSDAKSFIPKTTTTYKVEINFTAQSKSDNTSLSIGLKDAAGNWVTKAIRTIGTLPTGASVTNYVTLTAGEKYLMSWSCGTQSCTFGDDFGATSFSITPM